MMPSQPLTLTLGAVAELVGGRLQGDPDLALAGLAPLDDARPDQLAPLTTKRYAKYAADSRAGAFLVTEEMERYVDEARPRVVLSGGAAEALRLLLGRFHPARPHVPGVHPTAVVGQGVTLEDDVALGPYAVVEDGAVVGEGSRVGPHSVVGRNARVGRGCTLHAHVVLYPDTVVGDGSILHSGVVVGADGFGYVFQEGAHRRIPHAGRAVLGSHVEIGANSTVDRGSVGDTRVGDGTKIDNQVMVAHNVQIGDHSLLAAMVGIAGSTRVGKGVWMGGQAGVINALEIGDGARIAVAARVMRDVPPGDTVSGDPARPHREDLQRQANVGRIPRLMKRLEALEARIEALDIAAGNDT
jgi:UDP-3-O-[3-hydroxymyristoyl] glucosamine N-acyltransferase